MVSSPKSRRHALRALALALGCLALAPAGATPAAAKAPCAAADAHLYGNRPALSRFAVAPAPPPRPALPRRARRALSAHDRRAGSNRAGSKAAPSCPRPHRLAAAASSTPTPASLPASPAATAAGIKQLPPPHLPQGRSPRLDRHVTLGRSLAAGRPAGRRLRRGDSGATASGTIAEGTTEASVEVGVGSSTEVSTDGYHYSWALGYQNYPAARHVTSFWILQQNATPYAGEGGEASASPAHSIGQLWAIAREGPSCMSDVEIGWTVSSAQYGDLQPHLFIYAWDCGVGLGYVGQSSIPWVQYSDAIAPNAVLPHDSKLHAYGVDLYEGNWWFYYDGQWLGYIPRSAWTRFFPSAIEEGEAGGEVATPESEPCAPMGNGGLYGSDSRAALVGDAWYQRGGNESGAKLHSFASDANRYTTGLWRPGQPGSRFRYGGPGQCAS